jgi:hypothetical protein
MVMARKVGIGPAIFKIQGLSDGIDQLKVDDFGTGLIPQPNARPPKVDNAQSVRDMNNRAKREAGAKVLQTYGLMDKPPEPAKLQSNQAVISDDSGPRFVMTWPKGKKRLRRL